MADLRLTQLEGVEVPIAAQPKALMVRWWTPWQPESELANARIQTALH